MSAGSAVGRKRRGLGGLEFGYTLSFMAKAKVQFLCRQCGSVHPKWMGKCPDCGTWDALEEYKAPTFDARAEGISARGAVREGGAAIGVTGSLTQAGEATPLDQSDEAEMPRAACGIGEFDRIVGGGIVPGSAVLIGGEPGIGKSTLLLQVAQVLAGRATKRRSDEATKADVVRVLYVTSEESARQ